MARLWSCSAPATISEADAEPPLISTTTCLPSVRSPGRALARCVSSQAAALGEHDRALVEEVVGDGDRLVEQAAGVAAQVDHVALEVLDRLLQGVDLLHQVGVRLLVEGGDLDVDHVAFGPRLDGVDADHVAHDLDVEGIVLALAHDGERDRRVDRPAHLVDRLLERQADDLLAVQVRDEVVGLQPGLGRRRVVDGGDDLDHARPCSIVTSMPRPPNSPRVCTCMSR